MALFAASCVISSDKADNGSGWEYKVVLYTTLAGIQNADEALAQRVNTNMINDTEFQNAKLQNKVVQDALNKLGREGWELVDMSQDYVCYFKRRV